MIEPVVMPEFLSLLLDSTPGTARSILIYRTDTVVPVGCRILVLLLAADGPVVFIGKPGVGIGIYDRGNTCAYNLPAVQRTIASSAMINDFGTYYRLANLSPVTTREG